MAEILSQQEIDSLLAGIGTTSAAGTSEDTAQPREVVPFDFRLPHRMSKRQLQTLHAIHESFAETFSSFLVARLQTTASMSVVSVDQVFYSEYLQSVARPSCLFVFRTGHNDASGVIDFSPALVLSIVARMLGGAIEGQPQSRAITKIEQNIVKGIVLRSISDLENAWKSILESKFTLERYETEVDFLQITPASEIVLVVSFELGIGDQRHLMSVCFPTFALEGVLTRIDMQKNGTVARTEDQKQWSGRILKSLSQTKIQATCVLGETRLTLEQLVGLEPGDILVTDTVITGELNVMIGGKQRASGRPGISNGKKAVKITHIQETDTASDHDG